MKILERLIPRKQFYVICSRCNKEIRGSNKDQVVYNFKLHDEKCLKDEKFLQEMGE